MQPRTVHRTAPGAAVPHQDGAAGLDAELAAVVTGARRRAVRDRDRQTDTAHLLHALLEHDPGARAAVGEPRRLARLLGYLVQRSIGYGLRWQRSVEDSAALPAVPAPAGGPEHPAAESPGGPGHPVAAMCGSREPAARVCSSGDPAAHARSPRDPAAHARKPEGTAGCARGRSVAGPDVSVAGRDGVAGGAGGWSPAASAALAEARARARRRGAARVTGTDLLAALAADPRSRAVEVLDRAGIPARELLARIEAGTGAYADDGTPARRRSSSN
ncbi:Clp protease N-terminal domain-containing protein [Streptomyces sp. NPDC017095]|uniref:Clp protease N-terminal domain-containing protein n=1 Tax=Streptomyces sp. NPDC017095 TaxID=3364977 RepID=UPI0037B3E4DF